jgi:hypothetical protein
MEAKKIRKDTQRLLKQHLKEKQLKLPPPEQPQQLQQQPQKQRKQLKTKPPREPHAPAPREKQARRTHAPEPPPLPESPFDRKDGPPHAAKGTTAAQPKGRERGRTEAREIRGRGADDVGLRSAVEFAIAEAPLSRKERAASRSSSSDSESSKYAISDKDI